MPHLSRFAALLLALGLLSAVDARARRPVARSSQNNSVNQLYGSRCFRGRVRRRAGTFVVWQDSRTDAAISTCST